MKDSLSRAEEKGSAWITELLKEKRMQGGESTISVFQSL